MHDAVRRRLVPRTPLSNARASAIHVIHSKDHTPITPHPGPHGTPRPTIVVRLAAMICSDFANGPVHIAMASDVLVDLAVAGGFSLFADNAAGVSLLSVAPSASYSISGRIGLFLSVLAEPLQFSKLTRVIATLGRLPPPRLRRLPYRRSRRCGVSLRLAMAITPAQAE